MVAVLKSSVSNAQKIEVLQTAGIHSAKTLELNCECQFQQQGVYACHLRVVFYANGEHADVKLTSGEVKVLAAAMEGSNTLTGVHLYGQRVFE